MNQQFNFIILRMRIEISGVKADLRKLFKLLENDVERSLKLTSFEGFIDKNSKNTWWGFNNTKWREREDYKYNNGKISNIDFLEDVLSYDFLGKYLIIKISILNCDADRHVEFVPLIYFFMGNYGDYTELKVYNSAITDRNKVIFNFEDTIVSGDTKSYLDENSWDFKKEKLLTNTKYKY
ncbi:MAG: hypothetical protein L3J22_09910 [Xanthomonadales bacterium]|nr:hypothetical protein [Xanthomonadales bacterium]